ncbi:MAG: type II secretion system protein GspH [Robiginitomaculum sp.]|nr:MAG: type II secretion system protein GspH [Robiginitomaculum sp.]
MHTPLPRSKHKQAGFTLVEVMVVLLIMGVMAGMVIMNLPPQKDPALVIGEKLMSRLRIAAQSSMVENRSFGVKLDESGYSIVSYENNEWLEISRHEFELERKPILSLSRNEEVLNLATLKKQNIPVIRYDSTGLATPFTLSIETQTLRFQIEGAVDGGVTMTRGVGS